MNINHVTRMCNHTYKDTRTTTHTYNHTHVQPHTHTHTHTHLVRDTHTCTLTHTQPTRHTHSHTHLVRDIHRCKLSHPQPTRQIHRHLLSRPAALTNCRRGTHQLPTRCVPISLSLHRKAHRQMTQTHTHTLRHF